MEEEDKFKDLGVMKCTDGEMREEVIRRLLEERKIWGSLGRLWKESRIYRGV